MKRFIELEHLFLSKYVFFLSAFLVSAMRFCGLRRILLSILAALGLSFCIECLQLVLKVGFFELTDLVMNTVGGRSWRGDEYGEVFARIME